MKYVFTLIFVLFIVQLSFSQNNQKDPVSKIFQNLSRIESLYFKNLTAQERQEAVKLLNETRSLLVGNIIPTNPPSHYSDPDVLSEESFQSLYESIKKEISDGTKTTIILSIGKSGKITCAQLAQLVALYSFDDFREELLKAIADNIFDPVNIGLVLKYIKSSITRDTLATFFKNR